MRLYNDKNITSLGGDAVRLTISKIITLLISTITGMLLVRFRTLEEFGTYSALLLVINLFTALLMLGLPNSINYFMARAEDDGQKKHFMSVYYSVITALSLGIGCLLVFAIPLIEAYFKNTDIKYFFYYLALFPWASTIINSLDNVLVFYKKTGMLIVYKILYSLFMLLAVLSIQWIGLGFQSYMIVYVFLNVVFSVSVYVICFKVTGGIKIAVDKQLIKAVFAFSIPIGLSTLVGTLSAEIDKLLIGRLMDSSQFAIYSNAAKELPLTIVATSITAVLLPRVSLMVKNKCTKEAVKLWGDATVLSFIVMALIVSGIIVYGEDVMTLLYSEKYLPGLSVFRIYSLTLLVRCTYFGMILNCLGQTKKILVCSIANLVLNAILNPLFFYIFGMIGPALATLVSMLAIMFLMLYMTAKASEVSYSMVFPWKKMLIILLVNVPFCIAFWYIKLFIPFDLYVGSFIESLILGVIWSLIYFFVLRKTIKKYWLLLNS